MKHIILLLTFLAAIAIVKGAPTSAEIQSFRSFLQKAFRQDDDDGNMENLKNRLVNIQDDDDLEAQDDEQAVLQGLESLLATAEDDGDDDETEAELQQLFAEQQVPAEAQASYKSLYYGARRYGLNAYKFMRSMYYKFRRYWPYIYRHYRYYKRRG